ncbi:MAG: SDR family NAD(P)-dependent oxidoreductase [Thermoanaerobaculia bacterium]|nr:SDR family NAD(P)-dependent oxidoreductase [Thermoanaerobaculia bacterium]
MGKLDGKTALVTGASRGIGKEIAELFAAEGARVVCTARTVEEGSHPLAGSLMTTVEGIAEAGGEATAVACDVSEYANCAAAIAEAREVYGPIDVLVNNAALTYFIPVADFPINKWLRSTAVNFHAPFYLSQLVLPDMVAAGGGAIVNISSGAAIGPGRGPYDQPPPRGGTLYGAEKAALERFTQGLASEVYQHGVSVSCVSPSQVVATPGVLHHKLVESADDPRAEGPELMARATLLLATEPIERVSGRVTYSQEILVEFGWLDEGHGIGFEREGSGYSKI